MPCQVSRSFAFMSKKGKRNHSDHYNTYRLDLEIILHLPSPREGEPETVKSHGRQSSLHSDIIITSSEVECFNRNHEWETSSLS